MWGSESKIKSANICRVATDGGALLPRLLCGLASPPCSLPPDTHLLPRQVLTPVPLESPSFLWGCSFFLPTFSRAPPAHLFLQDSLTDLSPSSGSPPGGPPSTELPRLLLSRDFPSHPWLPQWSWRVLPHLSCPRSPSSPCTHVPTLLDPIPKDSLLPPPASLPFPDWWRHGHPCVPTLLTSHTQEPQSHCLTNQQLIAHSLALQQDWSHRGLTGTSGSWAGTAPTSICS